MEYRRLTKFTGVYARESNARTFKGRPDVCYDITYRIDNRKIWEKVGWESEGYSAKLASDIRGERLRSMRHGEELPKQKKKYPLFKEIAEKYLQWARDNKRSAVSDEYRYRKHLAQRFDNKRLNEISPFELEKMKSELLRSGLAPASVRLVLALFRAMINKAIFWKLYDKQNPFQGIKMPRVQNECDRFLSHAEARMLLDELSKRSQVAHDMSLLSLHTGMRRSEIFNLKWQDLDFQNNLVSIYDAKAGSRRAPITGTVRAMLLARRPENPSDYIFQGKDGGRLSETPDVFQEIADALFNQGVRDRRKRIVFHSLRHTYASWLIAQGESLLTVKEALGHKSLQMVQRYAHLAPQTVHKAALRLEREFSEAQPMDRVDAIATKK